MKRSAYAALAMAMAISLSGCSGQTSATTEPEQTSVVQRTETETETSEETTESTIAEPTAPEQDWMIPSTAHEPVGFENIDITVNGEIRQIYVSYYMNPAVIGADNCYCYYQVSVSSNRSENNFTGIVAGGKYFFSDEHKKILKEFRDADRLSEVALKPFGEDFKAIVYKGEDTEQIVISIPAGTENENMATLMIVRYNGRLMADMITKTAKIKLSGDNAGKYFDSKGNCRFFAFDENTITYLKVSKIEDGITYFTEYEAKVGYHEITTVETGRVYQTSDPVPEMSAFTINEGYLPLE